MCFFFEQPSGNFNLKNRFKIKANPNTSHLKVNVNGFEHSFLQVITNENPTEIQTDFSWGLVPNWSKNKNIQKHTLNARAETIFEKPSFKNVTQNRCLLLATSFYEWHWFDIKGKNKQKYQITSSENEVFCMAGIYSKWVNPISLEIEKTVTMVTTKANETMAFVHNHKQRMPIILNQYNEEDWLNPRFDIFNFEFPNYSHPVLAFPVLEKSI